MSFLTVILSILILRRWGSWKDTWPGIVLVLFPSGYLLMLQVGCALPGYPTVMMLTSLVIWLALKHAEAKRFAWIYALLGGMGGGLAASDTMLALPVLVAGGAMIIIASSWQTARWSAPLFAAGSLIGLAPHLAAKHLNKDAFEAVSQSVPLQTAFRKIISPTLDRTLPAAFGWGPTIFPDHNDRIAWIHGADLYIGILLVLFLAVFTAVILNDFLKRFSLERWPRVDAGLAFAGIAWMCLALFVASGRSHGHTYRYFIPFVFSFPFLIAYTYMRSDKAGRLMFGSLALLIACMNITATAEIIQRWNRPGFSDYLKSYDMKPVFKYLEQRGITRCYGTYTDAYRITYETDERIICCQPYNERFPGWHVPFSEIVNQATNLAFVLSDSYRFRPEEFEKDLKDMQTKYRKEKCGHYKVYTDFEFTLPQAGREILPSELTITTCCNQEAAGALKDRNYTKRWQTPKLQEKGMWIEIRFPSPRTVSQVKIYYNQYRYDRANAMKLEAGDGQKWITVARDIPRKLDCFDFINGHPYYMNEVQTIRFPAVTAERLRLEITKVDGKRAWTLGEIRVFEEDGK